MNNRIEFLLNLVWRPHYQYSTSRVFKLAIHSAGTQALSKRFFCYKIHLKCLYIYCTGLMSLLTTRDISFVVWTAQLKPRSTAGDVTAFCLNFSHESCWCDRRFHIFCSVPLGKCWDSAYNSTTATSPDIISNTLAQWVQRPATGWKSAVRFPAEARDFFLLSRAQNSYGAHSASYIMDTGCKATEAWSWSYTSTIHTSSCHSV
jgi:hypothetical protein